MEGSQCVLLSYLGELFMFKECKVLSYNKFMNILVFDYDGNKIQTTVVLDEKAKSVFVKYENGKYEIISKDINEKQNNIGVNEKDILSKPVKKKGPKTEHVSE